MSDSLLVDFAPLIYRLRAICLQDRDESQNSSSHFESILNSLSYANETNFPGLEDLPMKKSIRDGLVSVLLSFIDQINLCDCKLTTKYIDGLLVNVFQNNPDILNNILISVHNKLQPELRTITDEDMKNTHFQCMNQKVSKSANNIFASFNFDDLPAFESLDDILRDVKENRYDTDQLQRLLQYEYQELMNHPLWEDVMALLRSAVLPLIPSMTHKHCHKPPDSDGSQYLPIKHSEEDALYIYCTLLVYYLQGFQGHVQSMDVIQFILTILCSIAQTIHSTPSSTPTTPDVAMDWEVAVMGCMSLFQEKWWKSVVILLQESLRALIAVNESTTSLELDALNYAMILMLVNGVVPVAAGQQQGMLPLIACFACLPQPATNELPTSRTGHALLLQYLHSVPSLLLSEIQHQCSVGTVLCAYIECLLPHTAHTAPAVEEGEEDRDRESRDRETVNMHSEHSLEQGMDARSIATHCHAQQILYLCWMVLLCGQPHRREECMQHGKNDWMQQTSELSVFRRSVYAFVRSFGHDNSVDNDQKDSNYSNNDHTKESIGHNEWMRRVFEEIPHTNKRFMHLSASSPQPLLLYIDSSHSSHSSSSSSSSTYSSSYSNRVHRLLSQTLQCMHDYLSLSYVKQLLRGREDKLHRMHSSSSQLSMTCPTMSQEQEHVLYCVLWLQCIRCMHDYLIQQQLYQTVACPIEIVRHPREEFGHHSTVLLDNHDPLAEALAAVVSKVILVWSEDIFHFPMSEAQTNTTSNPNNTSSSKNTHGVSQSVSQSVSHGVSQSVSQSVSHGVSQSVSPPHSTVGYVLALTMSIDIPALFPPPLLPSSTEHHSQPSNPSRFVARTHQLHHQTVAWHETLHASWYRPLTIYLQSTANTHAHTPLREDWYVVWLQWTKAFCSVSGGVSTMSGGVSSMSGGVSSLSNNVSAMSITVEEIVSLMSKEVQTLLNGHVLTDYCHTLLSVSDIDTLLSKDTSRHLRTLLQSLQTFPTVSLWQSDRLMATLQCLDIILQTSLQTPFQTYPQTFSQTPPQTLSETSSQTSSQPVGVLEELAVLLMETFLALYEEHHRGAAACVHSQHHTHVTVLLRLCTGCLTGCAFHHEKHRERLFHVFRRFFTLLDAHPFIFAHTQMDGICVFEDSATFNLSKYVVELSISVLSHGRCAVPLLALYALFTEYHPTPTTTPSTDTSGLVGYGEEDSVLASVLHQSSFLPRYHALSLFPLFTYLCRVYLRTSPSLSYLLDVRKSLSDIVETDQDIVETEEDIDELPVEEEDGDTGMSMSVEEEEGNEWFRECQCLLWSQVEQTLLSVRDGGNTGNGMDTGNGIGTGNGNGTSKSTGNGNGGNGMDTGKSTVNGTTGIGTGKVNCNGMDTGKSTGNNTTGISIGKSVGWSRNMLILLLHEHAYQQVLTGIAMSVSGGILHAPPPLLPLTPSILQPVLTGILPHPPTGNSSNTSSSSGNTGNSSGNTGISSGNTGNSSGKIRRTYYQAFHHDQDTGESDGIDNGTGTVSGNVITGNASGNGNGKEGVLEEWMVEMLTAYWYTEVVDEVVVEGEGVCTTVRRCSKVVKEWLVHHGILPVSPTGIWQFATVFYYRHPLPTSYLPVPTTLTITELSVKMMKLLTHLPAAYTSLPTYFTNTLHYPLPVFCRYLLQHFAVFFLALFPAEEVMVLNALEAMDGYRYRYVLLVLVGWVMRFYDAEMMTGGGAGGPGGGIEYVQSRFVAVGRTTGSLAECFNSVEGWMISSHHSLTILSLLNTTTTHSSTTHSTTHCNHTDQ